MKSFEFEGWRVELGRGGVWKNIRCSHEPEVIGQAVSPSLGVPVPLMQYFRKYSIGWNGKRFARGSELSAIMRKEPALFAEICRVLGATTHSPKS